MLIDLFVVQKQSIQVQFEKMSFVTYTVACESSKQFQNFSRGKINQIETVDGIPSLRCGYSWHKYCPFESFQVMSDDGVIVKCFQSARKERKILLKLTRQ